MGLRIDFLFLVNFSLHRKKSEIKSTTSKHWMLFYRITLDCLAAIIAMFRHIKTPSIIVLCKKYMIKKRKQRNNEDKKSCKQTIERRALLNQYMHIRFNHLNRRCFLTKPPFVVPLCGRRSQLCQMDFESGW